MQDIKAWLDSPRDFEAGVKLYERYGESSFYKELFRSAGPTPFNRKKLEYELAKIALTYVPKSSKPVPEQQKAATPSTPPPPQNKPDDHARYLQLIRHRQDLYKQLDRNMAALDFLPSGQTLHETAIQVLKLKDKIDRCYAECDYYEEHGKFPDPEPEKELKTDEIQRLYVSISKAKKRLESTECKNPEKTKKTLAELETRLAKLKGESNGES